MAENISVDLDSVLIEGFDPKTFEQEEERQKNIDWETVIGSYQNQKFLNGTIDGIEYDTTSYDDKIRERNAFGIVRVGNLKGRMPLEETGANNLNQLRTMVGKEIAFTVVSYDKSNETFIPSRLEAQKIMAQLTVRRIQNGTIKEGSVIPAVATQVTRNAVYADIGGIVTKMPIKEVRHGYIPHLQNEVREGDVLKVKVIKAIVDEKDRNIDIKISARETQDNPWDKVEENNPLGSEQKGVVTGIDYDGAFVNLDNGVDSKAQHLKFEKPKVGDQVLVVIRNIDKEKRQVTSTIKRIQKQ